MSGTRDGRRAGAPTDAMWRSLRRLTPIACLLTLACAVGGDSGYARAQDGGGGVIAARVLDEAGEPIPNATVSLAKVETDFSQFDSLPLGEGGKYRSQKLDPGLYYVSVYAPGYQETDDRRSRPYRPGDDVTVRMRKGGAITGRLSLESGEPAVGILVSATPLPADRGSSRASRGFSQPAMSDDRGIYRIYGLAEGRYIVSTSTPGYAFRTAYEDRVPVYYPNGDAKSAAPVQVAWGADVSGIDFVYRKALGHTISGTIETADAQSAANVGLDVRDAKTHHTIGQRFFFGTTASFEYSGLADGEYEIVATSSLAQANSTRQSAPRRVVVAGDDVPGVVIRLEPMAALRARIEWVEDRLEPPCEAPAHDDRDTALSIEKLDEEDRSPYYFAVESSSVLVAPRLEPGRYRIAAEPPSPAWYLAAIERERSPAPHARAAGAKAQRAREQLTTVDVKRGEQASGIVVTFRPGASSLEGRVLVGEGESLPNDVVVYLVPREPEATGNPFRYYGAEVARDGSFQLERLAPGDYAVVTREITAEERRADEDRLLERPIYWPDQKRAALLAEAKASETPITLLPCMTGAAAPRLTVRAGTRPPQ